MKLLALIAAALLAACQPVPEKGDYGFGNEPAPAAVAESPTAAACLERGGRMQPLGRMQTMQCVVAYADAGRRCTDSDQCAGQCRITNEAARAAAGARVVGQCQADSNPFGCYTTVEDGRAQATICVD
jgi:putative hemolysin